MDLSNITKSEKEELFNQLVIPLKAKLYKTGMAILKNDDDCVDAIQNTLFSAYKNLEKLENEHYFSTWITRILINKCYDIIKANKKVVYLNQELEKDENDFYYDTYKEESNVEKALNSIDQDLRMVTILFYYDGFSIREIAEMCNIPEGTVKSRLSRSREKLYVLLKEEGDDNE
ncbi:MAG: sigma-70 family RNA polymerase sigma factor [Clostridia bacterium]|nr:sigma-70 family RNA polymerase sigma factor [Clostridia bacterium]